MASVLEHILRNGPAGYVGAVLETEGYDSIAELTELRTL